MPRITNANGAFTPDDTILHMRDIHRSMLKFLKKTKNPGVVLSYTPLEMHWDTEDPFLFASHHRDDYPKGNAQLAPPLSEISGRDLGRDYQKRPGFRMYNGKVIPGFPMHPHWGYESITVAMEGYVDHHDFLGNQGRYGFGDMQWLTAGGMYKHGEMYPLESSESRNPNDITQIMLNLPISKKGCGTDFKIIWNEDVPVIESDGVSVRVVAGSYGGRTVSAPNENSWASDPEHGVRILRIEMEPGASMTLESVNPKIKRNLYMTEGESVSFGGDPLPALCRFRLPADRDVPILNGNAPAVLWLLEGEPIGEKQASFGPVTLSKDKEVRDAMNLLRETDYKDWPWDVIDKAQPKGTGRFVRYADGREERPSGKL